MDSTRAVLSQNRCNPRPLFLSLTLITGTAFLPCIGLSQEISGGFESGPAGTHTDQAPTADIVSGKTSIHNYDSGTRIGLAAPLDKAFDIDSLSKDKGRVLSHVRQMLRSHIKDIDSLDLSVSQLNRTEIPADILSTTIEQRVHDNVVTKLEIDYWTHEESGPQVQIDGILVDPRLPQLDPSNWSKEQAALDLAISQLRVYAVGESSDWFERAISEESLKGTIHFEVLRNKDGISVMPIYVVKGHRATSKVNLYDGTSVTSVHQPKKASNEAKTTVCKPSHTIWHDTCTNNASLPYYTQTIAVFGEASDGSRVCLADPPFNFPVSTECILASYQKAHETIRQSEDLIDSHYPSESPPVC